MIEEESGQLLVVGYSVTLREDLRTCEVETCLLRTLAVWPE